MPLPATLTTAKFRTPIILPDTLSVLGSLLWSVVLEVMAEDVMS
jgi:hypothetical protein